MLFRSRRRRDPPWRVGRVKGVHHGRIAATLDGQMSGLRLRPLRLRSGLDLPPDRVPASFLVATIDKVIVGRTSIRRQSRCGWQEGGPTGAGWFLLDVNGTEGMLALFWIPTG